MLASLTRRPVLLVHGFEGYAAKDCHELESLRRRIGSRATTLGYYVGDVNYDARLGDGSATTDTPIAVIAGWLTEFVARSSRPVDLVGHSMGGLIIQTALASLPPGSVRRVVMLGVPFHGLPSAVGTDVAQCREMSPGSAFLAAGAARGWRAELVVASEADEAVPVESALPPSLVAGPGQVMRVPAAKGVHHGDLVRDPQVLDAVVRTLRWTSLKHVG